jgi:hypothetical protein
MYADAGGVNGRGVALIARAGTDLRTSRVTPTKKS